MQSTKLDENGVSKNKSRQLKVRMRDSCAAVSSGFSVIDNSDVTFDVTRDLPAVRKSDVSARSIRSPVKYALQPRLAVAVLMLAHIAPGWAEEYEPRGTVGLTFQYVHEDGINTTIGRIDLGTSDAQSVVLDIDYYLNDRWTLSASLPFVKKRYNGSLPHDPDELDLPHVHDEFLDDGRYHSDFQDFRIGVRYAATTGPLSIEPFLSFTTPITDYSAYAHAAVGQHLSKVDVGAILTHRLPLSDLYYRVAASRVFVEEVLGVNVDYWRLDGELGYFLNPRVALKSFFLSRAGNGLKFPDDFPTPRNDERWYEHEALIAREYVIVGVGMDLSLDERRRLSVSLLKAAQSKFIHIIDYGVTVGISHAF